MALPKDEDVHVTQNADRTASPDNGNIIGIGALVEGNIITHGNIRIEGKVVGSIKTNQKVAVGEYSYIQGNLQAQNGEIAGEVKGNVKINELLVLKPAAVIHGNISTDRLVVEAGAFFNGRSKTGESLAADPSGLSPAPL